MGQELWEKFENVVVTMSLTLIHTMCPSSKKAQSNMEVHKALENMEVHSFYLKLHSQIQGGDAHNLKCGFISTSYLMWFYFHKLLSG